MPVAACHASGIVLGWLFSFPVFVLLGAALFLALFTLLSSGRRTWLMPLLLSLAGMTHYTAKTAILSPIDLRLLAGENPAFRTVQGVLRETPLPHKHDSRGKTAWRSTAQLEVRAFGIETNLQPAFGTIAISTPGLLGPAFFAGRAVEITGVLQPPPSPAARGLFDYRAYLRSSGIYYQLKTESTNDWRLLDAAADPAPPWTDAFRDWAQKALARGLGPEDDAVRLLWAMTLGWKTALTDEVAEPFMQSGTLHVFAISGLHIALIAGILIQLLRAVQLPRQTCGLAVIPLLWFYTAATGWQASAIRSTLMMSVVLAGWSLNRPSDLLNSLGVSGLLILAWEPRQLFQPGFQLSFFVVLAIACLMPALNDWKQRLLQPDPLRPPELRPRWQRWSQQPLRSIAASAAVSLAAWLGSLPLIAHYFNLVTPISLVSNLVVVPLSSLALMSSLGSLTCAPWPWLHWAGELFNHAAWFSMWSMVAWSKWTAHWPFAFFYVKTPPLFISAIYYLLIILVFTKWLVQPTRRLWAIPTAIAAVLASLASWLIFPTPAQIHVLPLAGGVILSGLPGKSSDLLIDSGSASTARSMVAPFLKTQGLNRIPRLALTHGDSQHVAGTSLISTQFSIVKFVTSAAPSRSPAYRQILQQLEQNPQRWEKVSRGDSIGAWSVLHPSASDQFPRADANCLVLRATIEGVRVLLLSDLDRTGQRTLLEREEDLLTDIVVTGIPAEGEPLIPPLLQRINPQLIIVSSAQFPAGAQAKRPLRQRLAQTGIPAIYTSDAGSVHLRLRDGSWTAETASGQSWTKNPASSALPDPDQQSPQTDSHSESGESD